MRANSTTLVVRPGGVSVSFALLAALLVLVTIAGGASRADALGQTVVRAGAAIALAA